MNHGNFNDNEFANCGKGAGMINMKTYFSNGKVEDCSCFLDGDCTGFAIQELEKNHIVNGYLYPNDSIKYKLNEGLVDLYYLFRDLLFEDTEQYNREIACLPIWVRHAGQDSDCEISSEKFGKLMLKSKTPHLYRHLYLVDCQFLVGTVQNLLCAMEDAFINYYKTIVTFHLDEYSKELTASNGTVVILSNEAVRVSSLIETYFTKAYSILDIMCKICYEIQYRRTEFDSYEKLNSAEVLWGKRKKLKINEIENTIFERCDFISKIEAIRNEIVHNGTWELNPKVFVRIENNIEVERYMLFPDMNQGHLSTVKSRRHFFANGVKVNNILPEIHLEFKKRLLNTLNEIKHVYLNDDQSHGRY